MPEPDPNREPDPTREPELSVRYRQGRRRRRRRRAATITLVVVGGLVVGVWIVLNARPAGPGVGLASPSLRRRRRPPW